MAWCGRAEREEVDEHRLVVAAPVELVEAALRRPPHGDERRAGLGPGPVGAPVERIGVGADRGLGAVAPVEVLLREEDAGEEERGVHRGELDGLVAEPGGLVHEVREEAVIAGRCPPRPVPGGAAREKRSRGEGALGRGVAGYVARLDTDRIGGEREADRRDTGEDGVGQRSGVRPVSGLLRSQKKAKVRWLDGVEQGLDPRRRGPGDGGGGRGAARQRRSSPPGEESAGAGSVGRRDAHHAGTGAGAGIPGGHAMRAVRRCTRRRTALARASVTDAAGIFRTSCEEWVLAPSLALRSRHVAAELFRLNALNNVDRESREERPSLGKSCEAGDRRCGTGRCPAR